VIAKSCLIGALVVTALQVGAASAAATQTVSVVGSGNVTYPNFPTTGETTVERAIISARLLPSGEPSGSILSLSPFGFNKADVTCIRVVGDTVYVGGSLDPRFDLYFGNPHSQIAFGIREGDPDLVASAIFTRADVNPCDVLSAFPPVFPVDQGNFVISGV
jgi:hypothetical protein